MDQPIYDFVLERLRDANLERLREIAEGSGVSLSTLKKIRLRYIEDPGVSHIQKLFDYFRGEDRKPKRQRATA